MGEDSRGPCPARAIVPVVTPPPPPSSVAMATTPLFEGFRHQRAACFGPADNRRHGSAEGDQEVQDAIRKGRVRWEASERAWDIVKGAPPAVKIDEEIRLGQQEPADALGELARRAPMGIARKKPCEIAVVDWGGAPPGQ